MAHPDKGILLSLDMSNQAMESHGGNSNAYQWVKEDNLERLHAVWFKLCDILENAKKNGDSKKNSGCQGLGYRERWTGGTHGIWGWQNYSVWYYNGEYLSFYICPNP